MLVFDTQMVHFLAATMVCYSPALDTRGLPLHTVILNEA